MNTHKKILTMTLSALLIAVGVVIPMISPIKIAIGPMSFTLASHVAIMIGLFVSPNVSIAVALGTTLGFYLAGFTCFIAHCLGICRRYIYSKPRRFVQIAC